MNDKDRLIVILGPTATGKTALSVKLAARLQTAVISGDSMLIYCGLDIGSAKPDERERGGVKHYLIDILPPDRPYSVTQFQDDAVRLIKDLNGAGKIPVLAGGTGLYVKSLLEGYRFNQSGGDEAYRRRLERLADERGNEYVHSLLCEADPVAAQRLHFNDRRRVIRALEVCQTGGETISRRRDGDGALLYDAIVIGLTMERAALYERIEKRVDLMLANGLVEEVRSLLNGGLSPDAQSMKGIGYKEIAAYLRGECSLAEAADTVKKNTRHFAKRQLTWYRKMPYIRWFDRLAVDDDYIMEYIYKEIAGKAWLL